MTVVICDDDSLARRGLGRLLESQPGIVLSDTVPTFTELKTSLARHRPDVVLLDVNLPDADGGESVAELRDLAPDVALVLMSADTAVEETAARLGIPSYVKRFADIDELVKVLHDAAVRSADRGSP